jgi:hypothetical protein
MRVRRGFFDRHVRDFEDHQVGFAPESRLQGSEWPPLPGPNRF